MKGEIYVMRGGKLVPKSQAREPSAAPNVISDYLPDLIHPSTGKRMDSKSQFRAVTKAYGKTEVGNEPMRDTRRIDMPNLKQDIARAINELGG